MVIWFGLCVSASSGKYAVQSDNTLTARTIQYLLSSGFATGSNQVGCIGEDDDDAKNCFVLFPLIDIQAVRVFAVLSFVTCSLKVGSGVNDDALVMYHGCIHGTNETKCFVLNTTQLMVTALEPFVSQFVSCTVCFKIVSRRSELLTPFVHVVPDNNC